MPTVEKEFFDERFNDAKKIKENVFIPYSSIKYNLFLNIKFISFSLKKKKINHFFSNENVCKLY